MLTISPVMLNRKRIKLVSILLVSAILLVISLSLGQKTEAANMSLFNPGKIIDDAVFYNSGSMSQEQIQAFLNAKMPNCDTDGSELYTSNQTRAQYSATRGYYPPFTCLRDYSGPTTLKDADAYCGGYAQTTQSAAQMIYGVARSCGINPQVLIVLLQKEQGLVTDTWPWSIQYRSATGMGCPDTAACDSKYYGLFNQLYHAARQFKLYKASPSSYGYIAGRNNTIKWNPSSSCGTSTVYIENQATAGLYNYTPYRPNQAALNAGYGTGDSCSSYGNRNFWIYFTDWFGSVNSVKVPGCSQATNTSLACVWQFSSIASSKTLYTASHSEAQSLANTGENIFEGSAFIARNPAAPQPGNIPVYSVKVEDSDLLTTNQNEYNTLIGQGNVGKGIVFYADPAASNSGYPVYRLKSPAKGYTFTADQNRRTQLIAQGYADEGVAFSQLSEVRQEKAAPSGKNLVYRFYIVERQAHFFTADLFERDSLIKAGYHYEGVAWLGSTSVSDTPVYRLYSYITGKHLYTTSLNERLTLARTKLWKDEGISFYASSQSSNPPVYRLYSPVTKTHLLTTDPYERDTLVKRKTFYYEGIAWYQP